MRTLSTAQTAALAALDRATHVRVKVDDADGTPQNLSDLAGEDFLDQVVIDVQTDVPIGSCTISLRREINDISISPLREDSPVNVDSTGAYAPLLNPNRDVTVEIATMLAGETPASGDWVLLWEGIIDDVDWGGRGSRAQIHARDPMGRLNDTFIEDVAEYGDDGGTDDIEDVIQDILTAEIASPTMTLVYSATGFPVRAYDLGNVTVLEALQALIDMIGWNMHWRWDTGGGDFALVLWEPNRSNTTAAYTFGPDDYYAIPAVGLDLEGIRNKGEVVYLTTAGTVTSATDTRTISVGLYSTRFLRIDARGTSVVTSTQASTMLSNILDDLEEPAVQQQIECPFFWPVELGDLYAFSANDHYDTEQKWAVFGYRHLLSNGGPKRTTLTVSGAPSGGYDRWHDVEVYDATKWDVGIVHNNTSTGRDTGGGTSPVTLQTVTAPASVLGLNGGLRITGTFDASGTAASKSAWIAINSNADVSVAWGASDEGLIEVELVITNANDAASQYLRSRVITDIAGVNSKPAGLTRTYNTANNLTIEFRGDVSDAADLITLEASTVEFLGKVKPLA